MRLGGQVFDYKTPEEWVLRHREQGFTAAYFPLRFDADSALIDEYRQAAVENDIVIAEVGAWSNPMSLDKAERSKAITFCVGQLALADRVGALCCVNIAGSYSDIWDGPHPGHYSERAFDDIVRTTQKIIDEVQPKNTSYALETMPWTPPDSPECYAALIKAIAKPAFAAHLDVCNMINTPKLACDTSSFINRCVDALGSHIKSCHAKDIEHSPKFTVHLSETLPGKGCVCYKTLVNRLKALSADVPLMIEHLTTQEEYEAAARYIRQFM